MSLAADSDSPHDGVAIWSTVPPPYGGISIHVMRFIARLQETDIPFKVFDQYGKQDVARHIVPARRSLVGFLCFVLRVRAPVVHLHTNNLLAVSAAIQLLRLRRRRVIYSYHSQHAVGRFNKQGRLKRWFIRQGLRRAWHSIAVNSVISDWLQAEFGIAASAITVCPAYLPPTANELAEPLPQSVCQRLENAEHVLGSQGWFGPVQEGMHIYSFDMLHQLALHLRTNWPGAWMYTMISGTVDKAHREACLAMHDEAGLKDVWSLIEEPIPGAALISKSRLFLRPTTTDGDSVSVRECLDLGVPVLASDAVSRPAACHLFGNRDLDAFLAGVDRILTGEATSPDVKMPDNFEMLHRLYERALDRDVT